MELLYVSWTGLPAEDGYALYCFREKENMGEFPCHDGTCCVARPIAAIIVEFVYFLVYIHSHTTPHRLARTSERRTVSEAYWLVRAPVPISGSRGSHGGLGGSRAIVGCDPCVQPVPLRSPGAAAAADAEDRSAREVGHGVRNHVPPRAVVHVLSLITKKQLQLSGTSVERKKIRERERGGGDRQASGVYTRSVGCSGTPLATYDSAYDHTRV